jgi:hypothetical protein
MSAFCVFGVTYDACVEQAKKKVEPYIKEQGKPTRAMTPEEYAGAVREKADALFESAREKQISPAFDAPQFADDWIAIANRSKARALKIMRKGQKVNDKGAPILRNGKPVIGWIPYAA